MHAQHRLEENLGGLPWVADCMGLVKMVGSAAAAAVGDPVPKRTLRGRLVGAEAFTVSWSALGTAGAGMCQRRRSRGRHVSGKKRLSTSPSKAACSSCCWQVSAQLDPESNHEWV